LGFDVFERKEISEEKIDMLLNTMKAYRHLLNAYEVKHCKAAATSAMRDAQNSGEIIQRVLEETGIEIEVISGDAEAAYIYENHIAENMDKEQSYLYIDVGGGSTELTFFSEGKLVFKQSFNIGTIRLLKNQVTEVQWNEMKEFIRQRIKGHRKISAIGSGGNINKIFSFSKRKEGKPLTLEMLREYHKDFSGLTVEQRMRLHKLREDRADVLVPALQIYINVMRWTDIEEIYVPKIGLADGLVQHLYQTLQLKSEAV
jgi:exopolyphosphatase/guanosine-5'-triphosphate,3'-diphosphate pyrophosphatase